MSEKLLTLPVLALRGLVLFPGMTLHFNVGRKASVNAVKTAMETGSDIFLVAQKEINDEKPELSGLYGTGVVAEIKQTVKAGDSNKMLRVVVEGKYRASLSDIISYTPYYKGIIAPAEEEPVTERPSVYETALIRNTKKIFSEYSIQVGNKIIPEIINQIYGTEEAGRLADIISANILLPFEKQQSVLETADRIKRLELTSVLLTEELEIVITENRIHEKVQQRADRNQNEFLLREQIKAIYEELGEGEEPEEEQDKYLNLIKKSDMPDEYKAKLTVEAQRLGKMSPASPDSNVIRTYLDKCLALPWGKFSKDNCKIDKIRKQLNKDHYGLTEVKDRITEMMAVYSNAPDIKGQIICLAGPPGVGKTSIAKSIAKATGRQYQRIALGGIHDEAEIRGHRRTYIGAIPGRIINAVIDAGTSNPLILLDEIDKLGGDFKGDPASALLEVLDGEQNSTYTDHYIDLPFDLSRVLFITTANDKYAIPGPLADRMEIIDITSYTHEEKFNIAKKHLIPKQMNMHRITKENLKISDKALRLIIDGYTKESGVRLLERKIAAVCRKAVIEKLENDGKQTVITDKNIENYLGSVKYREEDMYNENSIGIVNGLAWTSVGGEMLQIETAVLDGTGKIELTGSLGDVMKESALTAISLIRSRAKQYNVDTDFYKNKDIHIHVPEGAVPKDGPSAGVTMTTSVLSALTDSEVNGKIAMTGEITLRGRVLPIGGLKEKSMAAYRHGIKKVLIPYGNKSDIDSIDETVKNSVEFIPVKTIDEVFDNAFINRV